MMEVTCLMPTHLNLAMAPFIKNALQYTHSLTYSLVLKKVKKKGCLPVSSCEA